AHPSACTRPCWHRLIGARRATRQSCPMNLEAMRGLATPSGQRLLASVMTALTAYGEGEPSAATVLALSSRLRVDHPADPVAAAGLLLTPAGLEQATRAPVAAHRAARLAAVLGAGASVADLCCGIGGDLLALARAGLSVTGLDRDPVAVEAARANLAACGLPGT